jgi:rod shape-determining protein MreD
MGDYRPKIEQRIVQLLARIAGLLLLVLFQTALAPSIWRFRADWVLVATICWTLLGGLGAGLRWAFIGGLTLDLLGPLPIGSHVLALLITIVIAAVVTNGLPQDLQVIPILVVLLASVLYNAILAGVMEAGQRPVIWSRYPITILLPVALVNSAIALPVWHLLLRVRQGSRPPVVIEHL